MQFNTKNTNIIQTHTLLVHTHIKQHTNNSGKQQSNNHTHKQNKVNQSCSQIMQRIRQPIARSRTNTHAQCIKTSRSIKRMQIIYNIQNHSNTDETITRHTCKSLTNRANFINILYTKSENIFQKYLNSHTHKSQSHTTTGNIFSC